jgi:hypothetical protein
MPRHLIAVCLGALWLAGPSLAAQRVEIPLQTPKDPRATTEAGIGSYYLAEHGDSVEVEAFDAEGALLADCAAAWLVASKVLTCKMGDGGRFRATWYRRHVELEDLVHGDLVDLPIDLPRGGTRNPNPPLTARHGGRVLQGDGTSDDVEPEWGSITPVFGYLMREVETTLGISTASSPPAHPDLEARVTEESRLKPAGLP